MSDTPETDAATYDDWSGGSAATDPEVSLRLERERDEARRDAERLATAFNRFLRHGDCRSMKVIKEAQSALAKHTSLTKGK